MFTANLNLQSLMTTREFSKGSCNLCECLEDVLQTISASGAVLGRIYPQPKKQEELVKWCDGDEVDVASDVLMIHLTTRQSTARRTPPVVACAVSHGPCDTYLAVDTGCKATQSMARPLHCDDLGKTHL